MKNHKIALGLEKLGKALGSLEQIANAAPREDRSNIDATIQRFEFTIELFWKLLQAILASKGIIVQYPKDVLKEAYQGKLIHNDQIWLSMLKDRNLTSHTYDEELADKIFHHIQGYLPELRKTFTRLNAF